MTEAQTRKAYIDVMLQDAGWRRGPHWVDEYPIDEMPNKSGKGAADYVLFADNGMPLAVIEAKANQRQRGKGAAASGSGMPTTWRRNLGNGRYSL